jgi:aryl-alcohol dehydrogenase-like predicted oxidoreductase
MQYRTLGNSGPKVSEIGFGGWALGGQWGNQPAEESAAALRTAIESGVNFIDTAEGYGDGRSERVVAQTLADFSSADRPLVATKTPPAPGPWPPSPVCRWEDRYGAAYLRQNVEERLRKLQVERLDVLQLHSWTRAWNDDPQPLLVLRRLREEGKIGLIGVSTPEQDQNCVIQLMRDGLVDCVQVIFNLFHQEPLAQLFPVAAETGTGVIVRVALDEGALTAKYDADHQFADDDFRHLYFAGDRMQRTMARTAEIDADRHRLGLAETYSMPELAIRFALSPPAVSTVITGIRNEDQARRNAAVSELHPLSADSLRALARHNWLRGVWYGGK